MKKRPLFLLLTVIFGLLPLVIFARTSAQNTAPMANPTAPIADIYIGRTTSNGLINTSNQIVFGPDICSPYGDPYSPFTPTWPDWYLDTNANHQGLSTYQYRILIPPDYPHDVVRIELFDPDSINRLNESATITHTAAAIALRMPITEYRSCSASDINPCLIDTGERDLGLPIDEINLLWFIRLDENRKGPCTNSGYYEPLYNTQTQYALHYFAQQLDETIVKIPLAQYIGQVGDAVRDDGDHETDMRWVSPGGTPAFDRPTAVAAAWPSVDAPATPGIGIESFEISLSANLPNIVVEEETGSRYLYLDVTAFTGASENGYDIWAGPPDYVSAIPGEVNARNVYLLDHPGSHNSDGIKIFARNTLPNNSNIGIDGDCDEADRLLIPPAPECNAVDIPLIDVPAEYAGSKILVSLFDMDSGSQPPIAFYFNTVTESDWSLRFGVTTDAADDPDANYWLSENVTMTTRCRPGACQNQWIDPPYAITIPTLDTAACQADPGNQDVCTPFYGGRLMARIIGGKDDTYAWRVQLPEEVASDGVVISGPTTGSINATYSFMATVNPISTVLPLTYTWQAAGYTPIVHTVSSLTDTVSYSWSVAGVYTITVATDDGTAVVSDTHTITINPFPAPADLVIGPLELITPPPIYPYEPIEFRTTIANVGDIDINNQFFVNIYFDPAEVYSNSIPAESSVGYIAINSLAGGASTVVTVTAAAGFVNDPANHQVYAVVDSGNQIPEADETNNITGPLAVNVVPYITLLPNCGSGPDILIYVIGVNWPPDDTILLYWDDILLARILYLEHNGFFSRAVPVIDIMNPTDGLHEIKAVGTSGLSVTAAFAIPCPSQSVSPPDSVVINGPTQGFMDMFYTFTAVVSPISTTLPLTYTWNATGQTAVTHTNNLTDTVPYSWPTEGTKTITITADNGTAVVTNTHEIVINNPIDLELGSLERVTPLPIRPYEPVQFRVTVTNTGNTAVNNQFFIDLYLDPTAVYTDSIVSESSDGYVAVNSLAVGASQVVTMTAAAGFDNEPANHQVYAMVDSANGISEADETNNIAGPLAVYAEPYNPSISLVNSCGAGSDIELVVTGEDWPPNDNISLYWEGVLQTIILASEHDGIFLQYLNVNAPTEGVYELRAVAQHGLTAVDAFTVPCPQLIEPPSSVVISGPTQGFIEMTYTFTATVSPVTATLPLTFTWETAGTAVTHTLSALTDVISFTWPVTGTQTIAVNASNTVGGPVSTTHTFVAIEPWVLHLPLVFQGWDPDPVP